MRLLVRFIGVIALAGAFAAAVIDGARWIADGRLTLMSGGAALYWLSPKALGGLQNFVESRFGPWAWDNVLVRALLAPVVLDLVGVSAILFVLSRPSPPEVGRSTRDR